MGANKGSWTVEMHDYFLPLFRNGMAYGDIAWNMSKKFPSHPVTRSAVAGHVFRSGLSRASFVARARTTPKPKRQQRATAVDVKEIRRARKVQKDRQKVELGIDVAPVVRSLLDLACWRAPMERTIGLEELTSESCRWPLTVDDCSETRYCANARGHGPYCLAHGELGGNGYRVKVDPNHKKDYQPTTLGIALYGR